MSSPPPDPRLGYTLKRAQHALRTMMDAQLAEVALTAPQYSVLSTVQRQPGISNASLARAAFVTAQTMQAIVANLERLGLLQREPHATHGRIRVTQLTKQGARVLVRAHQLLAGIEATMLARFSEQEAATLNALLLRCAENLEACD